MLAGLLAIDSLDYMLVLTGIMGLFWLICAYSAIGLFISSLTSYQVVAATGTFAVIALLNFIGDLWQDIPVINEIVYWISMSGRTSQMITGLISSKGILYFLIVILLFISLTILKLSLAKRSTSLAVRFGSYMAVLTFAIALGYITSRPFLTTYYDTTALKRQTLTHESQEVVAKLKDHPIKITSYVNIFSSLAGISGTPKHYNKNFRQLENYIRFLPHLEMDYVYFYDTIPGNQDFYKNNSGLDGKELAQKVAASYGIDFADVLSPDEIKEKIDLSDEDNHYVRQVEYNGKTAKIRMFFDLDHYPLQEEITAALKQLVTTSPKVAFTQGHGERNLAKNDLDYHSSTVSGVFDRRSLINKGFNFTTITLNFNSIPDDISILVLADPQMTLNQKEIEMIIQYINRGGNLLIMAEPDNRAYLEPIVSRLGIKFVPGQLKQQSEDFSPDFILGKVPESSLMLSESYTFKNSVKMEYPVSMPGAMGLAYHTNSPFEITPIVITNKNTINDLNSIEESEVYKLTSFKSHKKEVLPIALALNRKIGEKEQRIVVVGDADFMSNREWGRRNVFTMNRREFVDNMFRWLSNNEFPVNAEYPPGKDKRITIDDSGIQWLRILFLGIIPGSTLILGVIILVLRRRK